MVSYRAIIFPLLLSVTGRSLACSGTLKTLYRAPEHYTDPRQTTQSPDRLYKAPKRFYKAQKKPYKAQEYWTKTYEPPSRQPPVATCGAAQCFTLRFCAHSLLMNASQTDRRQAITTITATTTNDKQHSTSGEESFLSNSITELLRTKQCESGREVL